MVLNFLKKSNFFFFFFQQKKILILIQFHSEKRSDFSQQNGFHILEEEVEMEENLDSD